MFDIAWEELALILAVALIVIGPKDLPAVLRTAGQWVRRIRGLAGEFQRTVDDAIREAELEDMREDVRRLSQADLRAVIESKIDPKKEIETALLSPTSRSLSEDRVEKDRNGGAQS